MIRIHDNIFDKLFLLETSTWLMEDCSYRPNNVANRRSTPFGFEGRHRLMGCDIYKNYEGIAEKYWEYMHKDHFSWCREGDKPRERFDIFWGMYGSIQTCARQKCLLQGIDINLQFKGMDGTYHQDGNLNQTVFIMMFAYHDIEEDMGGEFFHESTGEKIPFKQGRVIEMTASDSHRADAFNVYHIPRFSIKFTGLNDEKTRIYMGDDTVGGKNDDV